MHKDKYKLVKLYLTSKPASLKALAVPPDATSFRPYLDNWVANSTIPDLSETLSTAKNTENHTEQYNGDF